MELKDRIEIITMVIGVICTIISICFGFTQINSTLKEQRFSNRLELADDMVNEYMSLAEEAGKAAIYIVADANNQAEKYKDYSDSGIKHEKALENMKNKILAYGSANLVNLFFDSYNDVQVKGKSGKEDFESYKNYFCYMPLIAAYIKYDLTGEKVNPSIFYNSCMKELQYLEEAGGMEDFHEKMIYTNDQLTKKYKLSNEFLWKE